MSTEAKGQRVNINGTVTDVLYKDEMARNTLSQLTYPGHDQAIMGTDSYVCGVGQKFAPTLVSNTSLKLADGEGVLQGVRFRIPYGSTVALTIAAGTSGYKRIDLVVARYTKSTGTINFVVIKGTNATSSPATPAYNTGSVIAGAAVVDFPLYKITLDGTTVSSVDKLFTQLQTMKEMQDAISKLNTDTSTLVASIMPSPTHNLDIVDESIRMIWVAVDATGFPSNIGSNAGLLIQGGNGQYRFQFILTFTNKIAIRNKYGSNNWNSWKYITAS